MITCPSCSFEFEFRNQNTEQVTGCKCPECKKELQLEWLKNGLRVTAVAAGIYTLIEYGPATVENAANAIQSAAGSTEVATSAVADATDVVADVAVGLLGGIFGFK